MKKIGEMSTMPGTNGFTMVVSKAEDAPMGTPVYIADGESDNDTVRFEALVEALSRKDVAFFAMVSQHSPKAASLQEVRHAVDLTIAELNKVRGDHVQAD